MTRLTVVIEDGGEWPEAWTAEIPTPHGGGSVSGIGATPMEAASKALSAYRMAVVLRTREEGA
jgi:hypothetical protein